MTQHTHQTLFSHKFTRTMNSISVIIVLVVASQLPSAWSYSSGAPLGEACRTLYPGHGVDKQYGRSNYHISAANRLNDSSIVVNIYSPTDTFVGFILQARLHGDREMLVNGAFSNDQYSQSLNCLGGLKVCWCCLLK